MNDNIKIGIGFILPASAIIGFFTSIFSGYFLLGVFIATMGILSWFIYSAVMQANMPNVTGNIIIFFGFLLSSGVFLSFGMRRNMFGGYEFNPEGSVGAAILLFLIVLVGVLFKNNSSDLRLHANSPPTDIKIKSEQIKPEELEDKESREINPFYLDQDEETDYEDYEFYEDGEDGEDGEEGEEED